MSSINIICHTVLHKKRQTCLHAHITHLNLFHRKFIKHFLQTIEAIFTNKLDMRPELVILLLYVSQLINQLVFFSLLVWLLKCAKLAKLELATAFTLAGAAKMSPPKSLRRSNLFSWNCCWWVCPRLTTGDWWRQEIDLKKLQVCVVSMHKCVHVYEFSNNLHTKTWGRQGIGLLTGSVSVTMSTSFI